MCMFANRTIKYLKVMKKVLLFLSVAGMLLCFSSCKKDCVCKAVYKNADGDKIDKVKEAFYDLSDEDKDECKEDNTDGWDKDPLGGEYKLKCHKVIF